MYSVRWPDDEMYMKAIQIQVDYMIILKKDILKKSSAQQLKFWLILQLCVSKHFYNNIGENRQFWLMFERVRQNFKWLKPQVGESSN